MSFGHQLKKRREELGLSQTQLSIICDCGTGTIGGIESGKAKPSFDMMLKIAEALKVTPADFFIRDISKSKSELKAQLKQQFDNILAKIQFSNHHTKTPKINLIHKTLFLCYNFLYEGKDGTTI